VPSLLAAIGSVIEEHMIRIGFLVPEHASYPDQDGDVKSVAAQPGIEARDLTGRTTAETSNPETARPGAISETGPSSRPTLGLSGQLASSQLARLCPRCANRSLKRVEGCWTCATCHYSRCG
jgi:ribonucleoside-diphosphate reductase alpha chain